MDVSDLIKAGFREIGHWRERDGALVPDLTEAVSERGAVYVFIDNDEIAYIGLSMMPLDKRFYFYANPGPSQSTNIRLKALILDRLAIGALFRILVAFPGQLEWNGLPLDVAPGLETALINSIQPKWNKKGSIKAIGKPKAKKEIQRETPVPAGDPSHAFWVYINDGRKRGSIHRADCGKCNFGRGIHGGGKRSNGYWRSFETSEDANAFARTVGYTDIKSCSFCGG
jgi:hypothetical protein